MNYKGLILSLAVIAPLHQAKAESSEDVAVLNDKIQKMQQQIDMLMANKKMQNDNKVSMVPNQLAVTSGQTKVKFYGNIRVDAAYDFKGTTRSIGNKTGSLPLNDSNPTHDSLNVSAATSRLGIDVSKTTSKGELAGKLEADFMGSSGDNGSGSFRVRHAYFSLGNFLVGQTTSPFVNLDTAPSLVDFTGPMGTGSQRNIQLRYQHPFTSKQKVLVALEGGDIERSNVEGGSRFPALTLRYDLVDQNYLMQLHGMLHEVRATSDSNDEKTDMAWGLGVGTKFNISDTNTLFLNYYHVEGDNRYVLYTRENDAFFFDQNKLYLSKFDTAQIGFMHQWNKDFKSAVSIASLWYDDHSVFADENSDQNEKLFDASANLFWTPVDKVDLGVEYTYGERTTFTNLEGDLSRVNLLAKYSF
jgi:hypothetical protein